jgi:endonuclease/exonuclease/phosphatase family metal-dependent hydrolase
MKIKVLSYNIHKGFSPSGLDFTLHQIRETLRVANPDILLLQEVVGENIFHKKKLKDWPTEAQFEFLADQHWSHYSYGKNAIYDGRHHGNAILSKFPIVFTENINISVNKMEQRGLLHAIVKIPQISKDLHLFNVHLNLFEKSRMKQMLLIKQRFEQHVPPEAAFILGGDFNDWTTRLHPMTTDFLGAVEAHEYKHKRLPRSFPAFFPRMSLDRVYVRHLEITAAETLQGPPWTKLSDHLPLMMEFKVA